MDTSANPVGKTESREASPTKGWVHERLGKLGFHAHATNKPSMLKNECGNQLGCPKSGGTSKQCLLGCASYNEVLHALMYYILLL